MTTAPAKASIPEHVPPDLVREFSIYTSPGMERCPFGNPHGALSHVFEFPRIFYSPSCAYDGSASWVVTRAADQRRILGDTANFSSYRGNYRHVLGREFVLIPLELDPPSHTVFRTLINPLLSPRRGRRWRPARASARCG